MSKKWKIRHTSKKDDDGEEVASMGCCDDCLDGCTCTEDCC